MLSLSFYIVEFNYIILVFNSLTSAVRSLFCIVSYSIYLLNVFIDCLVPYSFSAAEFNFLFNSSALSAVLEYNPLNLLS